MINLFDIAVAKKLSCGGGGGGEGRLVSGEFMADAVGPLTLNLDYSGNGYPIGFVAYPKGGTSQEAYSDIIAQNAIRNVFVNKVYMDVEPDYNVGGDNNALLYFYSYKQNSTSATRYTSSAGSTSSSGYNQNGTASSATTGFIVFNSNKQASVYIADAGTTGFLKSITYSYHVIYSE